MFFLDDLLEITDINLGVLRGGGDLAVAEDSLNVGDVGAALQEMRRACMSKCVRVKTGDAGGFAVVLDEPAEHHGADATTETGHEQRSLFRVMQ